jgi:hypothetical protein
MPTRLHFGAGGTLTSAAPADGGAGRLAGVGGAGGTLTGSRSPVGGVLGTLTGSGSPVGVLGTLTGSASPVATGDTLIWSQIQIFPMLSTIAAGNQLRLTLATADTPHLTTLPGQFPQLAGGV